MVNKKPKDSVPCSYENFRLPKGRVDSVPFDLLRRLISLSNVENASLLDGMCRNRDLRVLDHLDAIPLNYEASTPDELFIFKRLYQLRSLLSKCPFAGDRQTCLNNAKSRFELAEKMCEDTNNRFLDYRASSPYPAGSVDLLHRTREIIGSVLGRFDLLKALRLAQHGTGSINDPNSKRSSVETTAFFKYHDELSCTVECRDYVSMMVADSLSYRRIVRASKPERGDSLHADYVSINEHISIVGGNRVTFVPKNRDTDRAIAIEPSGNMALQIGCGIYIKQRLNLHKVDLYSQKKNQEFARLGSLGLGGQYGPFATIDLKMASDTISYEVVRMLLPSDWFNYLNDIRSREGSFGKDGELFYYHKFSSMGNATTFELESLIFYAITRASMELSGFNSRIADYLTVYGDDLAFPGSFVDVVVKNLSFFGFETNEDKSFSSGNFRESCGSDYILGLNVRPFFLRRKVSTLYDLNFVANSLYIKDRESDTECLKPLHDYIVGLIPKSLIFPIPYISREKVNKDYHDIESISELEGGVIMCKIAALKFATVKWSKRYFCFSTKRLITRSRSVTNRYGSTLRSEEVRYAIFLLGHLNGDITWRGSAYRRAKTMYYSNWV